MCAFERSEKGMEFFMNMIKNSMVFQMIVGAIILIAIIVLFAKFDKTKTQENNNENNTTKNEVENTII